MLYEEHETEIPQRALPGVVSAIPSPACLLGGWAVYYTVNANYEASTGRSYHGSRDIDLGFHLDEGAAGESMRESMLAGAVESLRGAGFRSVGMRLFKEYHRETRMLLSEERAKKTPSYDMFQLYVDILADNVPGGIKEAIGFRPLDEKRLAHVFKGGMYRLIDEFPARVILPTPPVLIAMKASSLPERTRDHKRHKDVMDMYALIWHSGAPMNSLLRDVSGMVSSEGMHKMLSAISGSDYEQAADALGVDKGEIEAVIGGFVRSGWGERRGVGGGRRRRAAADRARGGTGAGEERDGGVDGDGAHSDGAAAADATDVDGMDDQAVLVLRGVGHVRINDLESLKAAEAYMDILRERLSQGSPPEGDARAGAR